MIETKAPLTSCPTSDALLRYCDDYSSPQERTDIKRHLDGGCPSCLEDYRSLEFLSNELLLAQADRAELESFRPDRRHAAICAELTDERLAAIRAGHAAPDEEADDHLDRCPYCRCRLMSAAGPATDHAPLGARIVWSLIEPCLANAKQAVDAALGAAAAPQTWVRRGQDYSLAEALRVSRGPSGRIRSSGMSHLRGTVAPSMTMGPPLGRSDLLTESLWKVELPAAGCEVLVSVAPAAEGELPWKVSLRVELPQSTQAPQTQVTLRREGESLPTVQQSLPAFAARPLSLSDGSWELIFTTADEIRLVPLRLSAADGDAEN